MAAYRTILVGTDGSSSSFRAVAAAGRLSGDTGARLVLVCAYTPLRERDRMAVADTLGDSAYRVAGSTPADEALRAAREHAVAGGATDINVAPAEGDPVDVLISLAREREADLLVVGNRGLNSLAGRILGSVPANLSHRASCDVLIVHTTSGK